MSGKKVFIIEQDRITSLDLKNKLENAGYSADHVTSFVDTRFSMENNVPDLVVAYSDMRQMKGFDTFRSVFVENKTPIICIGTKSDFETQVVCKELNIVGMFMKPFDSRDLIAFAENYLADAVTK